MKKWKRGLKRITAIALAVLMVVTTVDLSTFAVSAAGEGSGTYCEHHTEHTPECGYTEGIEGSPCTHEHGEECYSEVTVCVHGHDESCGYVEGVEDSCTHICSLENGCIISALNCTHEHDEECGYQAAVEGTPCIFECEECATVCTCETDDPTYHAPFCDLYELPENPQCFCVEKCTEDSVNEWCDVCYGVGVEGCEGEAPLLSENVMATYASASTPVLDGKKVYANGTPITIEAGSSSSTASVWYMDGSTKTYVAQDVENAVIYGGCNGESLDSDTNITMTGGSVYAIYGGGIYVNDASKSYVNNVNISISGGTVSYGVFASNRNWVKGNVNITVTGGNIDAVFGCTLVSQVNAGDNQEYCKVSGNTSVTITGGTVRTLNIGDGYSPVDGVKTGIVTISGVTLTSKSSFNAVNDYDNLYVNDGTTFMVKGNVTLPENTKLIIPSGETFTLNGSTTIAAPYGIVNNGTINIEPGWTTSYNIENNGTLNISTLYTNSKGIVNNGTINLTKPILGDKPTGNGTINRNTAYISGISSVSSISVKMDDADYALANGYYETADGKLYLWLPSGYAVVFVDGSVYCGMANEGTAVELLAYKAVADIETVSSRIPVGVNYNLSTHAVTNNDASYKTIEWSVVNANGTGATITDNAIKATSEGTATIRATVNNGQAYGTAYTKDYEVTFYVTDDIDISLGSITISKKNDTTITVAGTGIPNGSKDYPIDESIRIIGSTTSNTITVNSGTTANVILNGVEIDCSNTGITPIMVESGATLNLTLTGDNVLTACTLDNGTDAQKTAALGVPVGAELVITENSTGTLTANGAKGGGAGIGGGYKSGAGTITINGGTVNATSTDGAGIGGGYNKSNDEVTRNGGTVTINGGTVDATSTNGAGIGGGHRGIGGTVIIKGGTVNATSISGAGIGGGRYSQNKNNYITVTIEGGTVNATSSEGAGIGGSDQYFSVTVTINGGTINAASTYGAGIGKGSNTGYGDLTVTITGGNFNYSSVTAPTNGTSAVACYTCKFIGNSEDMAGKTVTAITLENGGTYGLKDVVTFDGGSENEGYFNCYLPAGSKITSITVGGTTYNCRAEDGTCYVEHTWEDATCTRAEHCIVCDKTQGETISHNYIDGVCTSCGMDRYGTFHIKTPEQLVAFAQSVNAGNKDANAELDANIDMTGVAWTPICQTVSYHSSEATDTGYSGTFDGKGHTISNLTVTGIAGGTYSYGLFGTVSGTVKNLGMVNYTYTMGSAPDARAGSIAGQVLTGGTITNCYSVGHSVTTNSNIAGGIAGCNYGGTISNCYALNGSVSGYDTRWGGVVGDSKKDDFAPDQAQTYGTVSNCYTDDTRVVSSQNDNGSITSCAVKDDAAFASGEIAYLLNGSSSENVTWYQTLETDTYPVLDSEHGTVYSVFKCDGTTPVYRNVNENEPHTDNNSDGVCDVCGGNAHIHEWTYTASNNTITAVCGAADCPATGTNTIVISASDKNYDGTALTATVTNNVDTTDYSSSIVYKDNEGDVVDEAVNAGIYTANLTVGGVTASVEFTIAKVTPAIGTVSASNMENTLDVSQVVLSRSNETVPGTLSLAEGTTLQYGIHDYTYVFTPNDSTNYETVTGTVSITITDTNAPTATYKVGTDEWKQFINTITFGHFCKDYTTVDITYSDEGSGVADKQYYISDVEITNTENIQWSEYTDTLNINATGKYYIYVRVTDNYGNVVIQNSEGIVVYAESVIAPTSFSCEYGEENALNVNITTNGNTFAKLTDGSGNEIATENYSINGSTLTIKGEYLSDLDVGEYTYKICMNPQGVENTEVPLTYSFVVNVTAKELTVTGATATSRDYIANDKTVDITGITLSGIQGTDDVSVEITGLKGTLSSANAGTYTSVTLPTLTLTGDDAENYVLVQPTSAVATNVTINKLNPTITVGATEYYKTFGDADFTLDITDDNPEANVTYSSNDEDEDVVAVSNGTVSIKGAGSATITVSMGASTNYNAAVNKTITVNVVKATYSVDTINKNYLYTRINADSINLAELLPEDCGTVNYASVTSNGELSFISEPKVTNGILAYTLESGAADETGNIIVDVETQNYEDITITVNVTLIDKIPVNVDGEVELNSNVLTYGETLSGLTFKSVDFVDNAGNEVAGTLAWKEPSATPNAGTTSATWVFTPNNAEYASVEGTVAITVNKATPNVTGVPTVADRVYNPSVVLADSDLTGGTVKGVDGNSLAGSWSWQSTNVVPIVNNSGYIAVFTPTDSTNYETVTRTITVNVTKATPYVATKPTASALTYGQTLNQSVLSNGVIHYSETDSTVVAGSFAWEAGTVKPAVADSNATSYIVVFTPADNTNYNKVEIQITLTVNKAENAPNMPGTTMSVPYSNKTVSAVTLPTGWAWQDADKNTSLEVGVVTNATAVYTGTDKGNYENESVMVAITRSDCEHTNTEVRGAKVATCKETGYTGDTYCKDCEECIATGTVIPLADHTGGKATCKEQATCSVCGQKYGSVDSSNHGNTEVRGYEAATCTSGGYTGDKYCTDCGVKLESGHETDKLGHDYRSEVTKEPTTTEEGVRTYTCANCGDTYTESIPKLPDNHKHDYTYAVTKQPTCTETGVGTYTCSCGDKYTVTIAKADHSYKSEVTKEPTTTEEGEMTYTCSVCGHSYTKSIDKLTDNTPDNNVEPGVPFIKEHTEKHGWDAIEDELDEVKEGATVTIVMNGATVVPGNVFDGLNGKDVTVVFDMGDGVTWRVNGKDITSNKVGDIDFGVKIGDDANNTIPVEIINAVTGERYYINISLAYDGEFGFKAVLSLDLEEKNAGLFANLFYYNEQKGELEFICADEIAADGTVELTFTHASEYTIVIDEKSMATAPETGETTAPDTSDAWRGWWIIILGATVIIIGLGVFFVAKKRKEAN